MRMPARHRTRSAALLGAACLAAGCAQPGTQVPAGEAAKLDVAAGRMSVACGYEEELTATGPASRSQLAGIEAIALSGARKLASVFERYQSDLYQGESVGALVHDSISLLAGCRLREARALLQDALHRGG